MPIDDLTALGQKMRESWKNKELTELSEKYIGDALLQKTYTTDFLNKTRVKNNGIVPQNPLEQSRLQIHRLALHQQAGTHRPGMPRKNRQWDGIRECSGSGH